MLNQLRLGDHVCVVAGGDAERTGPLAEFAAAGIEQDQRVVIAVADPAECARFLTDRLPVADRAAHLGQLHFTRGGQTCLDQGHLVPSATIDHYARQIDLALRDGFAALRVWGDGSWATQGEMDLDALVEYETGVNALFLDRPFIAACRYDPGTASGAALGALCEVHPSIYQASGSQSAAHGLTSCLRCRQTPEGLEFHGEADLANHRALPALLAVAAARPAPLRIDATGLRFADARAAGHLLRIAADRDERPTTIECSTSLARLLQVLGSASIDNLTVRTTPSGPPN